uniref:Uncharacterized protein AlNc14C67G4707 n=1 Tax=Albugo laibachii Nc14 TaxID=890382 RepID=F0WDI7_9STRA|nr:conserved hypothetical protein [Albugo laibachii Nc14]|eukprot:CCA19260.1 conserved hypothetical protein [Albugo laibachii Nc14]
MQFRAFVSKRTAIHKLFSHSKCRIYSLGTSFFCMADALYHLGPELIWSPACVPKGELILLQDTCKLSAEFLVHHFTALFSKGEHSVIFVAVVRSKEHYETVARKMGVHLLQMEKKQKLIYLDFFLNSLHENVGDLFRQISCGIKTANGDASTKVVIFDDLEALKWHYGELQLLSLIRGCKAFTHDKHGSHTIVALHHLDTDLNHNSNQISLNACLEELATYTITVKPLTSGYSIDIDGTLTVQRNQRVLQEHMKTVRVPFKVHENSIRTMQHSGSSTLTTL